MSEQEKKPKEPTPEPKPYPTRPADKASPLPKTGPSTWEKKIEKK